MGLQPEGTDHTSDAETVETGDITGCGDQIQNGLSSDSNHENSGTGCQLFQLLQKTFFMPRACRLAPETQLW